MAQHHQYIVRLFRDSLTTQWGFRLQGGADLGTALSVQRVFTGSPAEGELQRGDVILNIGHTVATRLSHKEAEDLIKSAGGDLVLTINRTGQNNSLPHTNFTQPKPVIRPQTMSWRAPPPPRQPQTFGTDFAAQGRGNQANKAMLYNIQHNLDNRANYPAMAAQDMSYYGGQQGVLPGNSVQYGQTGRPQSYTVPTPNSYHPTNSGYQQQHALQHIESYNEQPSQPYVTATEQIDGQEEEEKFNYRDLRKKFQEKEATITQEVQREESIKRSIASRQQGPPPIARKPSKPQRQQQEGNFYQKDERKVVINQQSAARPQHLQQQSSPRRHSIQQIVLSPTQQNKPFFKTDQPPKSARFNAPVSPMRINSPSSPVRMINARPSALKVNMPSGPLRVNTPSSPARTQPASPTVRVSQSSPYQKATYIPPSISEMRRKQQIQISHPGMSPNQEGWISSASPTSPIVMVNTNTTLTKPRTRTSFAELTISHDNVPHQRRMSLQRNISQISAQTPDGEVYLQDCDQELYPTYGELRSQFLQRERNEMEMSIYSSLPRTGGRSMGTTFATVPRQQRASSEQPAYTRITPQRPDNQLGYQSSQQQNFRPSTQQQNFRLLRQLSNPVNQDDSTIGRANPNHIIQQQYYMPTNPTLHNYGGGPQQHYGWMPSHGEQPAYQPQSFNRPAQHVGAPKPSNNPYSKTATAAHLQYNSPLGLYSQKNAQNALDMMIPKGSAAADTIKLTGHQGGDSRGEIVDSVTLRTVLREDQVKASTGHNPDVRFYREQQEYGPGKGPLRQYKEDIEEDVGVSDF